MNKPTNKFFSIYNFIIIIFLFSFSYYILTYSMSFFYTIDSLPNNYTAMNYIFNKRLDLTNLQKYISEKKLNWTFVTNNKGVSYSRYSLLIGLLSVPSFFLVNKFYGVSYLSPKEIVFNDYGQYVGKLTAVFYISLSVVLLYLILKKINQNIFLSLCFSLIYLLCTNIFNTASQANFQHSFSLFFITLLLYLFINNIALINLIFCGIIVALLSQIRLTNIYYLFFTITYIILDKKIKKKIIYLSFLLIPFFIVYLIFLIIANSYSIPNGYQIEILQSLRLFKINIFVKNIFAILFSYNYGLFFYSPILILALSNFFIRNKTRLINNYLIISFLPVIILFLVTACGWWGWTGGRNLNARLLIELNPALIILLYTSFLYYHQQITYKIIFTIFLIISITINIITTYFIDHTISWYDKYTIHDPRGELTPQYELINAWYAKPTLLEYIIKNKTFRITKFYKKNSQLIENIKEYRISLKYLNIRKINEATNIILTISH